MNICSTIVYARLEDVPAVAERLLAMPGVEIHGGQAEGKLVVTVEDTESVPAADTLSALNQVAGVINTVLIYHYGGEESLEEVDRESHSA